MCFRTRGEDESTALVHVQLEVQILLFLERQDLMLRICDAHARREVGQAGGDDARARGADLQDRILYIVIEDDDERLQILDDLVNVFDDPLDRLVLDVPSCREYDHSHARAARPRNGQTPRRGRSPPSRSAREVPVR